MRSFFKLCWQGLKAIASAGFAVLLWTLWLALVCLLGVQIWWASQRELAIPAPIMRSIEERLALSQLHATFGRTSFDPSGRILVEDVNLFSPAFDEPLLSARSVYVRLDPWLLLAGNFEPMEIRASGVSLFVPAMLSATGRAEPLARDVELTLIPGEHAIELRQFTARINNLDVMARGLVNFSAKPKPGASFPVADFIAREYPSLSRRVADSVERLELLGEPKLNLELIPSDASGARVSAVFSARAVHLQSPVTLEANRLQLQTEFPLSGGSPAKTEVTFSVENVSVTGSGTASGVRARVRGLLQPGQRTFSPEEIAVTARRVDAAGFTAEPFEANLLYGANLHGDILARLADAAESVSGEANLTEKTATLQFDGQLPRALLGPISNFAKRDLGELLTLTAPPELRARVALGAGWNLRSVEAQFAARTLVARQVPLDFVSGRVAFEGHDFRATEVVLVTGESRATGTYTMDTASNDYRFLLTGHLRPPAINGWFSAWWPDFFDNFKFNGAPPEADVDVQGRWGEVRQSSQFVRVLAPNTAIRGVAFDQVRTTLFIRPGFYDALDLSVVRGTGTLGGTFTYQVTPGLGTMRSLDFATTSTLDVGEGARIFGNAGLVIVEPFRFATPPHLKISGHADGPSVPGGPHETIQIAADSKGLFSLYGFPLTDVSFAADLHDDDIKVHDVKMTFAAGTVTGHALVSGRDDQRRLSFDASLAAADLAQAITTLEQVGAERKKIAAPEKSPLFERAEVRLDLTVAGEGLFNDLLSFHGTGSAELVGKELGQVRLLGQLSELFNFTALRFTNMRTSFQLNGAKLEFPDVRLTGANSTIQARGNYALDRKELEFNAKLFPFGESKFIPVVIIGKVLAPFSQFLEVKLTGSLDHPTWAFVRGPTNFLRTITASPRTTPAAVSSEPSELKTNKEISPYLRR